MSDIRINIHTHLALPAFTLLKHAGARASIYGFSCFPARGAGLLFVPVLDSDGTVLSERGLIENRRQSDYKKAMLIFYEQNKLYAFKQIFIDQFEFAVREYF